MDDPKLLFRTFYRLVVAFKTEHRGPNFNFPEEVVIGIIGRHPGVIAAEISKQIAFDRGQLSRLLVGLDNRKLIVRKKDDKPPFEKKLYLTDKGQTLFLSNRAEVDAFLTRRFSVLSPNDRAEFLRLLPEFMTADAFDEDAKRCLDAGMNAHIAKPIEPVKLFQTLLTYIR